MSRPDDPARPRVRRPYEPPLLRRVRLVPDEAVLASCKNGATAGPYGPSKKCAGVPALCSHNAS